MEKGITVSALGRRHAALPLHDRAIALYEQLVNGEGRRELAHELAEAYLKKANAEYAMENSRDAVALHDRAIALYERLVNDERRHELTDKLARAYTNKGVVEFALAPRVRAMASFDRAIALYEQLVNGAGRRELAHELAEAYLKKANAEYAMENNRDAVALSERAIALYEQLVNGAGRRELADKLARAYIAQGIAVGPDHRKLPALTVHLPDAHDLEAYRAMVALYDRAIALYAQLVNNDGRRELNRDLRQACARRERLISLLDYCAAAGGDLRQAAALQEQLDLEMIGDLATWSRGSAARADGASAG
jgi:tetratricopeptide (TPR) repeat protein